MFTEIGEIKTAINTFTNNTTQQALKARWERDFNLYRMKPYDASTGYYSYTGNDPRVYADRMISMLVNSKLIIRIPLDVLKEDERRTAANIERYLYGALNLNDERLLFLGIPPLKDQIAWYADLRGAVIVKIHTHKNDKGKTVPAVDAWDIYSVAYGQGKDGLSWAAYSKKMTKSQIKDEYDKTVGADEGDVIEYYDSKNYGVIVNNEWGIELQPHGFDYCPVFLIGVGAMPPISQTDDVLIGSRRNESIYAPNRFIYPILNKTISDHLTIVRRGVKPPMGYWSAMGEKTLDEDIWQVEKGSYTSFAFGEEIKPIIEPTLPADTAPLLAAISAQIQRGSLPHTAYGELGFRLSGFAINQLQASMETILAPYLNAGINTYRIVCLTLLSQFAKKKLPPIYVRGRTSRGEVFGMPKAERIKPSELEGEWHPEIRLEPTLPKDEAQRYIMANMAREGEVPLLSYRTIRDELLMVEDPDLEQQKVDQEWAAALIIPRLYEAYVSALEDKRPDVAENIRAELERLLGQIGAQTRGGAGRGAQPSRMEQTAAQIPGAGAPPGATGVPSSVLPSEALGGLPGGAAAAQSRLF